MTRSTEQTGVTYALDADEGQALWYMGTLLKVKATGAETGGKYSLVEELCSRGFATPWHVQGREDESFLVIEGEATFFVGDHGRVLYIPAAGYPARLQGRLRDRSPLQPHNPGGIRELLLRSERACARPGSAATSRLPP
jgi:hypothetical protein